MVFSLKSVQENGFGNLEELAYEKWESVFSDGVTMIEGMKRLSPGWICLSGDQDIKTRRELTKLASEDQLLLFETNSWC